MIAMLPGIITAFREGLEALLILVIILKFLEKTNNTHLKKSVLYGAITSVIFSGALALILELLSRRFSNLDTLGKLWESGASLAAVGLVTTLIIWMINHTGKIKNYVEQKTALSLKPVAIFMLSVILIAREGVEIVLFSFAGQYTIYGIAIGLALATLVSIAVYFSLWKIKLGRIFQITLAYLVIQAGYLIGIGIHEALEALKSLSIISPANILSLKLFDLSPTILNHKNGPLGLPANVILGWHSKPEWLQFVVQYLFTLSLCVYWYWRVKKNKHGQKV